MQARNVRAVEGTQWCPVGDPCPDLVMDTRKGVMAMVPVTKAAAAATGAARRVAHSGSRGARAHTVVVAAMRAVARPNTSRGRGSARVYWPEPL